MRKTYTALPSSRVVVAALILSRETLIDEAAARHAVSQLDDAKELLGFATQMYSLPMVAKHLNNLRPDWCGSEVVKEAETSFFIANLLLRTELKTFHQTCIVPTTHDYAYIKGIALAQQFYDRPNLRYARDVDVLVPRCAMKDVVERALAEGYRILDIVNLDRFLEEKQDIRAALRYLKVVSLISPKGQHIEVHGEIDKEQGIFDERQMLIDASTVAFDGIRVNTLDPVDHFIYVAYHCARHNWSKLHWLTDLDAMVRSSMISREDLFLRASEMGLRGLVEETLGFISLSANPGVVQEGELGERILAQAIDVLIHGERHALDLRNSQTTMALPFPELLSVRLRNRIQLKRLWGRLSPQFSDYHAYPVPDHWQWIYRLTGPTSRILQKMRN